MNYEHSHAVSFANGYFALVDGFASGLENHLAEDVILDWFGRTIKGRRNVTAFIQTHKINSRHIFPNITPVTCIRYKKDRQNRNRLLNRHRNKLKNDDATIDMCRNGIFSDEKLLAGNNGNEKSPNYEESKDIDNLDHDETYDLNENDLSTLFKVEITSTDVEEIERNINRLKLEEEMAPTIKAVKRECGQGDGPNVIETSTIKYVEASGQIEFSRKLWKKDGWDEYTGATLGNNHTWRRSCKLQVAYSVVIPKCLDSVSGMENSSWCSERETKPSIQNPCTNLLSLLEISELTDHLVPNTKQFAGYFQNKDFPEDRENFLQNLETEIQSREPNLMMVSPHYVKDRLVFDKLLDNDGEKSSLNRTEFIFNYQIHLIIYEGSNKCKMNLLQQFESQG